MTISDLLEVASNEAMRTQPDIQARWVAHVTRFATVFGMALIRPGDTRIDMLLRSLEDERMARQEGPKKDQVDFAFDLQVSLSNAWMLSTYDALAAIRPERRTAKSQALYAKAKLVRVPTAKAEIANDRGLKGPLSLKPLGGPVAEAEEYIKGEYRMPTGLDVTTGSYRWFPFDVALNDHVWISRRELSDEFLALFD
ncbi:MAG: hypothetical protein FD152_842 [Xanthobacteraceae bacterium]|nr:MAG: hypothetical protein FD152_842 [Xanthobacteraceae bacterium]